MSNGTASYIQQGGSDAAFHSNGLVAALDHRKLVAILGALFAIRLMLVFWFPFTDSTEARYAEIARKMVETNDWITPQYDYGVPFWGKPPLHTWLSAIGMKLFGVGAFGARALIFACALGVLGALYVWARSETDRTIALVATLVCASSVMFFGASAFVMTDIPMVLGTTLAMIGFFIATTSRPGGRLWGHLFFLGLAIGMLAKGPTAVLLAGIPVFLWLLIGNRWRALAALPWLTGLGLACLLTAPWYVAAELKTPGFLHYFIIGEHFERFLVPGWQGDLYGSGRKQPKGMIWLFALGVFLPWTVFLAVQMTRKTKVVEAVRTFKQDRVSYLLLWSVAPMLLFTPAANILPAYILPAIPAFSFLVAIIVVAEIRAGSKRAYYSFWACLGFTLVVFGSLTFISRNAPHAIGGETMSGPVADIQYSAPEASVTVFPHRVYSAEFYTRGTASVLSTTEDLSKLALNDRRDAIIVANNKLEIARTALGESFSELALYRRHTVFLETRK